MSDDCFSYSTPERFADIQMLRYNLPGFDELSLKQKLYIYHLSKATLYGRDITFDQFGRYNLRIRKLLEAVYLNNTQSQHCPSDNISIRGNADFEALTTYLKQVWFSSGIHHHYGCEKFIPAFGEQYLLNQVRLLPHLPEGETLESIKEELFPIIFQPEIQPKRVNKAHGEDLVLTSACNYYQGVSQAEVEDFYQSLKEKDHSDCPPSFGLNTTLVKDNHGIHEISWTRSTRYGAAIDKICHHLELALPYAENAQQQTVIHRLIEYYTTGDLHTFDTYSIEWLKEQEGRIDFINGFIEVYGDPLGLKASWEGIVHYKDMEATRRTQVISDNAQWFENHSPVDPRYRKPHVKGVTANAVSAAMLGGDEYPSSAIGINLPNADWIRAQHGSKSVTITNLTHAYAMAAQGNGFKEEFIDDSEMLRLISQYATVTDNLHTNLHECLGHGSGQLLSGTDPDALKNYGNTIEEARADLFGLYYIADEKMLELGLLDSPDAYKAQYYEYLLNGLMTQLVRIKPGQQIEEAHMRNRALIAHWVLAHSESSVYLDNVNGKTYLRITDYDLLRQLFAQLLAEIQRIKSEGDFAAASQLVEQYAVNVNPHLHAEVLERYARLNIAPYKGFINPRMRLVTDSEGNPTDVTLDFTETYIQQMLRYSREYATL